MCEHISSGPSSLDRSDPETYLQIAAVSSNDLETGARQQWTLVHLERSKPFEIACQHLYAVIVDVWAFAEIQKLQSSRGACQHPYSILRDLPSERGYRIEVAIAPMTPQILLT